MKNTLNNIAKNPAYAEQLVTLHRLETSLADTQAEIKSCDAKLATIKSSNGMVADVLAMLAGKHSVMSGKDDTATQKANAEIKAHLIKQAMEQQYKVLNSLASVLSGEVAISMRGEHAEAVRTIANAMKALDVALESEEAIRDRILQAGYRCTLPYFGINEVGRLKLPQSPMVNHYQAANNYVADYDDDISGKLDKPATVHLLADMPGIGKATEVVSMAGRDARTLVRHGHAEITTDKPRRVAKPARYLESVLG